MKKMLVLATAALLFSGVAMAHKGHGKKHCKGGGKSCCKKGGNAGKTPANAVPMEKKM